jgi:hypothetical protein
VAGTRAQGGPVYMICPAPDAAVTGKRGPQCEMFLVDPGTGLRVHARFSHAHARAWQKIEARLSDFLQSWTVRN